MHVGDRKEQQDRVALFGHPKRPGMMMAVLADGMGGHSGGAMAAEQVLIRARQNFEAYAPLHETPEDLLRSVIDEAHTVIKLTRFTSEQDPHSTAVVFLLQQGRAYWAHCGDSRLYMVRDGELLTRTRDHSYLELRNAPPPGLDRINRNVLFTCLGSPTKPIYDITGPVYLEQGDRILLCSDGLWGTLSDEDIAKQLGRNTVSHAVPELVEDALRKAGDSSDNVTVIALEWETPDAFESTQGVSTDSISDDVFASTIQAGPLDGLVDDLDDAAIERSIAEINEAIRRSAARKA